MTYVYQAEALMEGLNSELSSLETKTECEASISLVQISAEGCVWALQQEYQLSDSGIISSPTHGSALCCGFGDGSRQLILGSVASPINLKVI